MTQQDPQYSGAPPASPYGAPSGYAPTQYPGGVYPPVYAPPTNSLAIVALILGFLVPIGGIICGHIALGQIKRTGEGGHGLALAGTILGYVFTGVVVLAVLVQIAFLIITLVVAGAAASYSG